MIFYFAKGQDPCASVSCLALNETECTGCGVVRDGCCDVCCPTECASCEVDPCEGYACQGFPGFTCKANYCGGCNREWFTSAGELAECSVEIFGEHPCALIDCMPPTEEECNVDGACGLVMGDGCCSGCCEEPCMKCITNPCEGYICEDNQMYTCQANYCGGCNRQWLRESVDLVHCFNERLVNTIINITETDNTTTNNNETTVDIPAPTTPRPEWFMGCRSDVDCSLRNIDHGFACCDYEGMCDTIDYSLESWVAVNNIWWTRRHDQCNTFENCGARYIYYFLFTFISFVTNPAPPASESAALFLPIPQSLSLLPPIMLLFVDKDSALKRKKFLKALYSLMITIILLLQILILTPIPF